MQSICTWRAWPRYKSGMASGGQFTVKEKIGECLALRYIGNSFTCHWIVKYSLALDQPPNIRELGSEWRRPSAEIYVLVRLLGSYSSGQLYGVVNRLSNGSHLSYLRHQTLGRVGHG